MTRRIEQIVAEALGARPTAVDRLGGGCVAEVWRARLPDGRRVVVKRDEASPGSLDAEAFMLDYLAERTGLPAPAVIAHTPGALVMEFVEGTPGASGEAEADAARLLADLHDITADAYGFERETAIGGLPQPNHWCGSWLEFFAEWRLRHMARLAHEAGRLPARARGAIDAIAGSLDRWLVEPPAPSLIHGDVWAGNVLSTGGRVTAFLDPALAYADAEHELAFITLFSTFGERFFDAYSARRPIRDGFFETRRRVYNLYPLLVHARLFGGSYSARVADEARRLLGRG
ncbi:MAG: fructosamine kinase [Planctomycetota bacterium]|nr:MAG: fructosamine kinase [Planctomycetota bacterium]